MSDAVCSQLCGFIPQIHIIVAFGGLILLMMLG